ncbi:ABC transporter permease [Persicitalea jodogahamensis]|uniref:ABC transporter permease n=1 Tax=Persicitalea jodogahamensis TaxID=402147 RepID=A0A8J3G974_9BACT|nr:FtsX-like permease family protein [Persicitalea jodogahamensis]GHB72182.1 ABC transporter permease [Persicitalea jodogahamensis]
MRFPAFIADRIRHNAVGTFSATVTRIGIASIAVSTAVGILAFAVLFGFKAVIQEKVFLFGAHLRVNSLTLNNSYEEAPMPLKTTLSEDLSTMPEVAHWQAVAHKSGILKTPDELKGVVLKGVGRDYDWKLFEESLVEGRLIQYPDSGYAQEIILSQKIAHQLRLKAGDDVLMYFVQDPPRARKLNVVGIYETDMEEFDNTLIVGDLALIQRLNDWGPDTVGTYEIYLKDFSQIDASAEKIFNYMDPDMFLQKVTETFRPVFEWLLMLDRNTAVFMTLILFVASFNMISILLVMIMERTPLVGLLKTLGSPDRQIRAIFVRVGVYIVLRGLLIGNVAGLFLAWLQWQFHIIPLDQVNYFMDTVPIVFDWGTVLLINLLTLLLVGLVLLIPTYVITRIQPIKALLFKK